MADFELKVVGLFCRRDAGAQLLCRDRLPDPANIVALALDRHQRGPLDRCRHDPLAVQAQAPLRQILVVK
jgi:hypothetical protein